MDSPNNIFWHVSMGCQMYPSRLCTVIVLLSPSSTKEGGWQFEVWKQSMTSTRQSQVIAMILVGLKMPCDNMSFQLLRHISTYRETHWPSQTVIETAYFYRKYWCSFPITSVIPFNKYMTFVATIFFCCKVFLSVAAGLHIHVQLYSDLPLCASPDLFKNSCWPVIHCIVCMAL